MRRRGQDVSGRLDREPAALPIHRIAVPTPFPVGDVNAWLLGAEPLTLVDCGPLTDEAWEALCRGLERAGRTVGQVCRLVLTHPHQDHAGLAERMRRESGCSVLAHPADRSRLLGRLGEWEGIAAFLLEVCRRAGAPATHLGALGDELRSLPGCAEPLGSVEPLEEGGGLSFDGGRILSVLHTPGHARGALCLWDAEARVLLSGDTLLGQISSNALAEPGLRSFRQHTLPVYLESLRRLAALDPLTVLPGHGEPLAGGVGELVKARLAFYEKRLARIRDLVAGGQRTPWEIADVLFPGLPRAAVFLAVSEVLGHLDLLAERGEVAFEGQGEGEGWSARPLGS